MIELITQGTIMVLLWKQFNASEPKVNGSCFSNQQ